MPSEPCRKKINRVLTFVNDNVHEKITSREMAEHACMSVHHFTRSFKVITGTTPGRYVTSARVECAKCKLARGLALAVIAVTCGFANQAHMTRTFKAHTGQTPAQFQRTVTMARPGLP